MSTSNHPTPLDPVSRALANAPLDDEPETDEERAQVEEAKAEIRRGEFVRHQDLEKVLGWK